ncbi:MAG: hypothetical protein ACHQIG_06900 [Acidimicrobiia bacterium]
MENYFGAVSIDGSDEILYLELSIDDLDSPGWIGAGKPGSEVPGVTTAGDYCVKLMGAEHPRRGQTATAAIEVELEDAVLRLAGRTAFA